MLSSFLQPQAWASVYAARLGDGLADHRAMIGRAEYADGELVDFQVVRMLHRAGSETLAFLRDMRDASKGERRWQDGQDRPPGGVGGVFDITRFPGALTLLQDAKSRAAPVLLTSAADDRRDGPQTLLSHARLVSLLRVQLSRGRIHVDPAIADDIDAGLNALTTKPPTYTAERVPVTDTDGPTDTGLVLALAVRAAVLDRPASPVEERRQVDAMSTYRQRNFRLI